ncbi:MULTISPECIES: LPXTG cell wall anchor domain-containing protein [unclassified Bradyrhizobium]|nr:MULTISPECIES: LPXTG cell wall anchor domain-containing protein [unclassified Bradyrhizobium]MCP3459332.1 twin-arginine translocase TatA/TatE family subunit [Bradyrhizobium sp. CCGUVB23]
MLDKAMQLQLPHWLIIAGVALVIFGTLGMLFRRRKDLSSEQSAETNR